MKQERTLKTISITLENVITQLDIIDDFLSEHTQEHPEHESYQRLLNYVWESVVNAAEQIKTLY